jgi:uncharacterized membrane protein
VPSPRRGKRVDSVRAMRDTGSLPGLNVRSDWSKRSMRIVLAFALIVAVIGPAEANLTVCNKGAHEAKVALGRFNGTRWSSEGWWHVPAKKCAELIAGKLNARYYYLYATDGAAGTWDGSTSFCTGTTDKFSIVGRGGCVAHGFDRRGFFEVDTRNHLNWTQSLSD